MKLVVKRRRETSTDRKGRPTGAQFVVNMRLEADEEERRAIRDSGLERKYLHEAPAFMLTVVDLLSGVEKTYTDLEIALAVERAITEHTRSFGALLEVAQTYDGATSIDV